MSGEARIFAAWNLTGGGFALNGIDGDDIDIAEHNVCFVFSQRRGPVPYVAETTGSGEALPTYVVPLSNPGSTVWKIGVNETSPVLPITSGVLQVPGPGFYFASGEANLEKVSGLYTSEIVYLSPASGHTFTVKNGAYLKTGSDWLMDSEYDVLTLASIGGDVCKEIGRDSNA